MKTWVALGVPAFACVLAIYFLMVTKLGMDRVIISWSG
jgi:uncharacterized membrane protein